MNIPGSNLLKTALTLIGKQEFQYYRFKSRSLNVNGQDIPVYEAPLCERASIQPVPRELFQQYGLDFQKHYITIIAPLDVMDIRRDVSGDLVVYGGLMFQCLSKTQWFKQDGWGSVIAVQIQNQPLIDSVSVPPAAHYVTSNLIRFVIEFNFPVTVTEQPFLDLTIGTTARSATFQAQSFDDKKLNFAYTVQSSDSGALALEPFIDLSTGAIQSQEIASLAANVNFTVPSLLGISFNA